MTTKLCISAALTTVVISAALLFGPAPIFAQTRYSIVDLGRTEQSVGTQDGAMAINDRGQVVGVSSGHGFLWTDGRLVDLGTLPPTGPEDDTTEIAFGINNREQIVGASGSFRPVFMSGLQFARGVIVEHRKPRQFTGHNASFIPYAINDAGQIVGLDAYRGFFYSHGKLISLGTLSKVPNGNCSTARGLNQRGQVVGWTTVNSARRGAFNQLPIHAFLWQRGVDKGRMRDLGTLPGWVNSYACAINRSGEIAGSVSGFSNSLFGLDSETPSQAFVWRGGKISALANLPGAKSSAASAINDSAVIAGTCDRRAVTWVQGKAVDLNTYLPPASGWVLEEARAINNPGQIAGTGTFDGEVHLFLLTPR